MLEKLGNPEQKLAPVIHVAGTNGKGSVTQYIRAALEASGKRVHTYTSPHLVRFHERIRIARHNGVSMLITEAQLVQVLEEVEKVNAVPDKFGKWQIVTAFPDTKVQIVTAFPDVKVQYVTAFPGVP